MRIMSVLGRMLLAPVFLYGGWDTLQHPAGRVQAAQAAGTPYADLAVRANAAVMVGAGGLLLVGILPRWAAGTLAAILIPTTFAGHPFWNKQGPERKQQLVHALKNAATIGGLLLVASDADLTR